MSAEVLGPACELAFAVAREGLELDDPVEPPPALRSFLDVDDLPRRAIAAAQQVIEENSDFRHRVASHADEREVGRAGYLWLHRPAGWAAEFEALAAESDLARYASFDGDEPDADRYQTLGPPPSDPADEPIELVNAQPPEPEPDADLDDGSMASVLPIGRPDEGPLAVDLSSPSSSSLGLAPVTDTDHANSHPFDSADLDVEPIDGPLDPGDDGDFEAADALESELDSLRGLVARLANERDTVESTSLFDEPDPDEPVEGVEPISFASPGFDDDEGGLRADLESAHHELYLVQADLTIARQEREEAQRLQSEALKRQVQLDKELANVREQKAELELELSASQAKAISIEERIGRVEGRVADVERERDNLRAQLDTMTLERNQIRDERATVRAERDEYSAQLDDIAEKTGGVDLSELAHAHQVAKTELETTSGELARVLSQAEKYEQQLSETTIELTGATSERNELKTRLGEVETQLEVTSTQYDALKIDAERSAAELGALRAERDGLQGQLAELQAGLSEVLDEQAESRQRNDADRRALNEIRVDYDVVAARLADLELSEQEARDRIEALITERDELVGSRDELLEERGQLRAALGTVSAERTTAGEQLADAHERLRALESDLQVERRQRDELANRLVELDDLAERNVVEQQALVDQRDLLAEQVAQMESDLATAKVFRQERDDLAAELASTKAGHEEALEAVRGELDQSGEEIERLGLVQTELEQQLTTSAEQVAELEARLLEAEAVRQERDELANQVVMARANHDDEAKTLRAELDDAAKRGDALETARVEVERQVVALEAKVSGAERARDQAITERKASQQVAEELRSNLTGRSAELEELRGALATVRKELEDNTVALQIKEGELRTVLGARNADAEEIKGLRGSLTEVSELESQVKERSLVVAARDAELAELRAELAALKAEHAASDEGLSAPPAEPQELTRSRAELEMAKAELEGLKVELEEARVELARTTAELQAQDGMPASDIGPPPVDALLHEGPGAAEADDELDSMAAEVRSALRGPTVLDAIAGPDAPSLLSPDAGQSSVAPPTETVPAIDGASTAAGSEAPSSSAALDDDELDTVSELISMKLSTFGPGDADATGGGYEDLDLAAELARTPTELSTDDIDEALAGGPNPPSILGEGVDALGPAEQPDLAVRRPGGAKRRRIDVPGDIVDDEVAVARYVVGSPDVVLLVDGDSVAQMGWPSLPVAQQRDALVTYLADLSSSSGAAPDVVFDGRLGDDEALPASRAVRIRLSTPPTPPTAALDELVDAYPEQWPIALVTDDADLASAAVDRGAAVLNNGQLLDLFIAE